MKMGRSVGLLKKKGLPRWATRHLHVLGPALLMLILINVFAFQLVNYLKARNRKPVERIQYTATANVAEFEYVLYRYADQDKVILLALVDSGFLDMTLNFYETSIARFEIRNYLFIASDYKACNVLAEYRINCYVYMADDNGNKSSVFETIEFNKKMNIRTFMILDALKLGFTVLHSDVDIVFLKNPFLDMPSYIPADCDMAVLWDVVVYNAGFLYIRPSLSSIKVYEHMNHTAHTTTIDDQKALNKAVKQYKKLHELRIAKLPPKKYACGKTYFEKSKRQFAGYHPCSSCVVVHNNWIVSKEAKRYRFREAHLWMYDGSGYYTNPDRQYLTYTNPEPAEFSDEVMAQEVRSLRTALYFGMLLNRTVVLPRFHKRDLIQCAMNSFLNISHFDRFFENEYRESSFLAHPKVPKSIKETMETQAYWIQTNTSAINQLPEEKNELEIINIPNPPTAGDIRYWFGSLEAPVLRFASLHGVYEKNFLLDVDSTLSYRLKHAFRHSNYRQFVGHK